MTAETGVTVAVLSSSKYTLRGQLRARRQGLSRLARRLAEQRIVRHAVNAGLHWRARRFGVYAAHGAELGTRALIARLLALGKDVYLPVLAREPGNRRMWFARVRSDSRWRRNRFGIAEIEGGERVRASGLDILFLPLVGYDAHGYRLGMGGGFYDASLAHLHLLRVWRKPLRIGVAYSVQYVAHDLPHEPWDVPLDAILTERGLHYFPLTAAGDTRHRVSAAARK